MKEANKTVCMLAIVAMIELLITESMAFSFSLFVLYGIYVVIRDDL